MRKIRLLTVILLCALLFAACGTAQKPSGTNTLSGTQRAVVEAFDFGPAVTKSIITLDEPIREDSFSEASFTVTEVKESFDWSNFAEHTEAEAPRTVTAAYLSDETGSPTNAAAGNILTLELYASPEEGGCYCYDMVTWHNTICDPYRLKISLAENLDAPLMTEDGKAVNSLSIAEDLDISAAGGIAIYPQLSGFDLSGTFTGSDGISLTYAFFEPADDAQKHPLVIWLHGAGEGGEAPEIALFGNKVSALGGEAFQQQMGGAYVLVPQTPTFWMQYDEQNWSDNAGVKSYFHDTLMELIRRFLEEQPQIDPDRIYVGGCSNGGYMTMELLINEPGFFAAAFPICEAYPDAGISDDDLAKIAQTPLWFTYAKTDTTVAPGRYSASTIQRLKSIGADVHSSVFNRVEDTSGTFFKAADIPYEYNGHWSWIYFFNNECEEDGERLWTWMAEQKR